MSTDFNANMSPVASLDDGRTISGFADDGYGRVLDTFVSNFVERDEVGAGCTVYSRGKVVVDLVGGIADNRTGQRWSRDTAALIFSCTKGILAICAYTLAQQGRLDLDAPIDKYWPEWAGGGKGEVTVRDALSHRAGVPSLDVNLTRSEVVAWEPVIKALEDQAPAFRPHEGHVYHALTIGWIVGEVIRRITDLTPGAYFRSVAGDQLQLETWIGTPPGSAAYVAWMEPPLEDDGSEAGRIGAHLLATDPGIRRSLDMGGSLPFPARDGIVTFNDPLLQEAEIPGANGVSTAASLARLYSACVTAVDGRPLLTASSIADALTMQSSGPQLSGWPDDGGRWGTGFQISSPPTQPMLGPFSFGHTGAGGQLAFADIAHEVGFAYLANQMGGYGDSRARRLTLALRDSTP